MKSPHTSAVRKSGGMATPCSLSPPYCRLRRAGGLVGAYLAVQWAGVRGAGEKAHGGLSLSWQAHSGSTGNTNGPFQQAASSRSRAAAGRRT